MSRYSRSLLFAAVLLLVCGTLLLGPWRATVYAEQAQPAEGGEVSAALDEARQMSADLANNLRTLLTAELKQGSFQRAVEVCSKVGQEVPRRQSEQSGNQIRRVSLRYRNVKDRPDKYEWAVLQEFDRLKEAGKLPPERYELIASDSGRELRYLKPLVTADMCLNCHGPQEKIPPEVKSILARLYPEDKATGYQSGDVRGAISVSIRLNKAGR